jgi:regulator of sirC expression with transglutaminase-like and TPR domain
MKARQALKQEMLNEYDFSKGRRGKSAARYARGTNIVRLESDVAAIFPTAKAVNQALRLAAEIAKLQPKKRQSK